MDRKGPRNRDFSGIILTTLTNEHILNGTIGIYAVLVLFGLPRFIKVLPQAHWFFVGAPVVLWLWVGWLTSYHWRHTLRQEFLFPQDKPYIYENIKSSDFWRAFFVLLIGYSPLGTDYFSGFWLVSAVVLPLIGFLITTVIIELYRKKELTPFVVGLAVFAYFAALWEKDCFVHHYGVPIIGHFFEKPIYDTQYYLEVRRRITSEKEKVIADIHVQGRTETEQEGEDEFRTYTYRDVFVKRFQLRNGEWRIVVEQFEFLHLNNPTFVTDQYGEEWYVRLLNEPVR
jgi:hypothetical protein